MNILFASQIEPPERWLPLLERALPNDRLFTNFRHDNDIALVATNECAYAAPDEVRAFCAEYRERLSALTLREALRVIEA